MGKLAFVFPGQGSQAIGMCADLAVHFPLVSDSFDVASAALGYDLWQVVQAGPAAELNRTEITQPALLSAGYAIWQVWQQRQGRQADILAGHSLGEYTALVCAGVLEFAAAVKLVQRRGQLMQAAVSADAGGMAAIIGLDDEAITGLCEQAAEGAVLSAANFNSPGQVVIAGELAALERACTLAKSIGAKMAKRLDVSVPSHCALMQTAADTFAADLQAVEFAAPQIPVVQNVDAQHHTDPASIRTILLQQLYRPVCWRQSITGMRAAGVDRIVECGPGKVLAGLIKRIDKTIDCYNIQDTTSLDNTLEEVAR
ncbi:MAG: ACP S-malonyltransferase [Gammaproteobacteria bacterium]